MKCLFRCCLSMVVVLAFVTSVYATTVTLTSPGGSESVDGGLRVILDPYGGFGSSAQPANNAWFNPPGSTGPAGTTYESAVFLRGAGSSGFLADGLIGSSGGLPSISFQSTAAHSAVSSFNRGNLGFQLTQTVRGQFNDAGTKVGSVLVQDYKITNTGTTAADFALTRYIDGDLYFSGGFSNDWGGTSITVPTMNQQLFEFDSGDNPSDPTTLLGIRAIGGVVPTNAFEIDSFSGLLGRIISGTPLDNRVAGDGPDSNLVTDGAYDITMALQRDFSIAAGEEARYVTTTEFGQGETGEEPMGPVGAQHVDRFMRGSVSWIPIRQRDSEYDIEFTDSQELVIDLDVRLTGDPAVGPGGEDLRSIWEQGIEDAWSNQYEIVDGIHRYPIVLDIIWVDSNADVDVEVHTGQGGFNSLNFYTDRTDSSAGLVAAHEAGHWLGLYDEYNPQNSGDPAWWPLYNSPGATDPFLDFNALWNTTLGWPRSPRDNWADLSQDADETGLMGQFGPVRERYFLSMLEWMRGETDRELVLGQAPTWLDRDALAETDGDLLGPAVPEPMTMLAVGMAVAGLGGYIRKRRMAQ